MNFFKLYIGDYQRDTAHLSVTEHGAYMLMLQHYYATEKPLPLGKALHRMLRAQDKAERDAIDAVASQFWRTTDEGLVNDRADEEITKAGAQADTNSRIAREREAARKAAREQHEQSTKRATNDGTKTPPRARNHSQTPDTRNTPKPPRGSTVHEFPPGFAEFWAAYPKKVGKDAAAKAFKRKASVDLLPAILAAIESQKAWPGWLKDGGQFIPNPATWLNDGRWQDEQPNVTPTLFAGADV